MVIISYLLMCLIFGTTFLAIKLGVDSGLPPFLSAGFRFFIAGFMLTVIMIWRRKATFKIVFRKEMVLIGVCLTFGTFSTLYWAEQYVTSGVAAVLSAAGPMMILFIQTIFLKQKGNLLSSLGCMVGMIGVFILLLPTFIIKTNVYWVYGCLAVVLGTAFYSAGTIYSKHVMSRFLETSPIALNAIQMMYGGLLLIILSFLTERGQFDYDMRLSSIGSLVYLIVFGSMIAHSIYYWLVARTNPIFPSTWQYISPIIAVVVGAIFYNEHITWLTAVGTMTIIAGTILANFQTLRRLKIMRING